MTVGPPLVALISATPAAIAAAETAFARNFPGAQLWNILDDRLLTEADARGGLDDELRARMGRLIDHALAAGAAGVLLTCSMYAPVARARSAGKVAVLAPDDAAFERIADLAPQHLLVVGSLPNALQDSCDRLRAELASRNVSVDITATLAVGAFEAVSEGDTERLFESIRDAVGDWGGSKSGPVFLAQYSLAPAATLLTHRLGLTVITGPDSAAETLRDRISRSGDA
jgi:hypothetical protein